MPLNTLERSIANGLLALLSGATYAQCDQQVAHLGGTQTVGTTAVTVNSSGTVDSNTSYCTATWPYFIGYTYGTSTSGTGSYTFQFNPPIDSASINVSGLSQDASNAEEVWLFVNGSHYAIPEAGTTQICDPLAVLTPNGDIGACSNCSVSGWGGTVIPGPISSLVVMDSVLMGAPAGGIFSLFICDTHGTGVNEAYSALNATPYPNPAADVLSLDLPDAAHASVMLFDASGRQVPITISVLGNTVRLSTAGLPKGIYALRVQQGEDQQAHRVVVE